MLAQTASAGASTPGREGRERGILKWTARWCKSRLGVSFWRRRARWMYSAGAPRYLARGALPARGDDVHGRIAPYIAALLALAVSAPGCKSPAAPRPVGAGGPAAAGADAGVAPALLAWARTAPGAFARLGSTATRAQAAAEPDPLPVPDFDPLVARFGRERPAGTSLSLGTAQNGRLRGGAELLDGPNLSVLPATRARGFQFGTAELVALVQRGAEAVASEHPGSVLRVGNLSSQGGGDIAPSVSHNSGRDADVAFFATDRSGAEVGTHSLVHFDELGIADAPGPQAGRLEFDTARNWTLVRHWLSDPVVVVQWIFVSVPLRNRLLDYALRQGEPESLRQRAQRTLVQPRDSSPHADHFHLRIACPVGDRPACLDGPGHTALAREAQVDALLQMYRAGSPAEQRYARELLSLPADGAAIDLPPIEGDE